MRDNLQFLGKVCLATLYTAPAMVLLVAGYAMATLAIRGSDSISSPDVLEPPLGFLLFLVAALVLSTVVYLGIQFVCLWAVTRSRPSIRIDSMLTILLGSRNHYLTRRSTIAVALGPLALSPIIGLPAIALGSPGVVLTALATVFLAMVGSASDLYVCWLVVRLPPETLFEHTGVSMVWYLPEGHPALPTHAGPGPDRGLPDHSVSSPGTRSVAGRTPGTIRLAAGVRSSMEWLALALLAFTACCAFSALPEKYWTFATTAWLLAIALGVVWLVHRAPRRQERTRRAIERSLPPGIAPGDPLPGPPLLAPPTPFTWATGPHRPPSDGLVTPTSPLAIDPDGRTVAVGLASGAAAGASADSAGPAVRLWAVEGPSQVSHLCCLPHPSPITALSFGPHAPILAAGCQDGSIVLWHLGNRAHPAPVATIAPREHHHGPVNTLGFSSDGNLLAAGGTGQTPTIWNLANPEHPTRVTSADPTVGQGPDGFTMRVIRFSPDGRSVAVAGHNGTDTPAALWDASVPGRPAWAAGLRHHPAITHPLDAPEVLAMEFSPEGDVVATASVQDFARVKQFRLNRSAVMVWRITDPACPVRVAVLEERGSSATSFATASPAGKSEETERPGETLLSGHAAPASSLGFSPDGHYLATGGCDGVVLVWDVDRPDRPRPVLALPHPEPVTAIVFSSRWHLVSCYSSRQEKSTFLRLWDLSETDGQRLSPQSP